MAEAMPRRLEAGHAAVTQRLCLGLQPQRMVRPRPPTPRPSGRFVEMLQDVVDRPALEQRGTLPVRIVQGDEQRVQLIRLCLEIEPLPSPWVGPCIPSLVAGILDQDVSRRDRGVPRACGAAGERFKLTAAHNPWPVGGGTVEERPVPAWRNGRRSGLKIRSWKRRGGSSPPVGSSRVRNVVVISL